MPKAEQIERANARAAAEVCRVGAAVRQAREAQATNPARCREADGAPRRVAGVLLDGPTTGAYRCLTGD